jgi:RluA family pseudouridine synthase
MAKIDPSQLELLADDDLLVVNKPAGLLTLPHGYQLEQPFLVDILKPIYGSLWVVHRLDRDTSGVILFARNGEAHRQLNTQFERRRVTKFYHALVLGETDWDTQAIDLPLKVDGDRMHRTVVDYRAGKPANTLVRLLERFARYALVEAQPHSGRRHQIRAHLAARGNPIVADSLYGNGQALRLSAIKPGYKPGRGGEKPLLERLGLHAVQLTFNHPTHGHSVEVQAPYPKDFKRTLAQLRKYRSRILLD